jgi:DNA invertase Pin-like site-specific DNA recombinase
LLVAKLDRLSRRVSFIASLMDDKRLSLKVATMPHAEKFQLHIYAALAEQERDFISQRTKAALAQAKARGVKLGGPKRQVALKMGWKKNKADAVKHAENLAPIINAIQATGVKTLQGLSDALNIRGVRTRRGGTWHPTTVKNILDRTTGN